MPTLIKTDDPLVCAIDPGLTTGFACYRQSGLLTDDQYLAGQSPNRFDFYDAFDQVCSWGFPLVVVMEKFTITGATAQKSPQYDALWIQGAIERQCYKLGFPYVVQTPAEAKAFSTDAKLKSVGWWIPGNGHAMDAARHLLKFLVSKRQADGGAALLEQIVEGLGIA